MREKDTPHTDTFTATATIDDQGQGSTPSVRDIDLPTNGDEESSRLAPWQTAWLSHHRRELAGRLPTMHVTDLLVQRQAIDPRTKFYQKVAATHRRQYGHALILLDHIDSQTQQFFWSFQEVLAIVGCSDLAIRREDSALLEERFTTTEHARMTQQTSPNPALTSGAVDLPISGKSLSWNWFIYSCCQWEGAFDVNQFSVIKIMCKGVHKQISTISKCVKGKSDQPFSSGERYSFYRKWRIL